MPSHAPKTIEPQRADTAASIAARMDILIAELKTSSPSRKETIGVSLAVEMKNLRTLLVIP